MTDSNTTASAAFPPASSPIAAWYAWQTSVVAAIREEFRELFASVHHDDVDWDAWRPLYEAGWSPADAVKQALSASVASRSESVGLSLAAPSESKDRFVPVSGPGSLQTMAVD